MKENDKSNNSQQIKMTNDRTSNLNIIKQPQKQNSIDKNNQSSQSRQQFTSYKNKTLPRIQTTQNYNVVIDINRIKGPFDNLHLNVINSKSRLTGLSHIQLENLLRDACFGFKLEGQNLIQRSQNLFSLKKFIWLQQKPKKLLDGLKNNIDTQLNYDMNQQWSGDETKFTKYIKPLKNLQQDLKTYCTSSVQDSFNINNQIKKINKLLEKLIKKFYQKLIKDLELKIQQNALLFKFCFDTNQKYKIKQILYHSPILKNFISKLSKSQYLSLEQDIVKYSNQIIQYDNIQRQINENDYEQTGQVNFEQLKKCLKGTQYNKMDYETKLKLYYKYFQFKTQKIAQQKVEQINNLNNEIYQNQEYSSSQMGYRRMKYTSPQMNYRTTIYNSPKIGYQTIQQMSQTNKSYITQKQSYTNNQMKENNNIPKVDNQSHLNNQKKEVNNDNNVPKVNNPQNQIKNNNLSKVNNTESHVNNQIKDANNDNDVPKVNNPQNQIKNNNVSKVNNTESHVNNQMKDANNDNNVPKVNNPQNQIKNNNVSKVNNTESGLRKSHINLQKQIEKQSKQYTIQQKSQQFQKIRSSRMYSANLQQQQLNNLTKSNFYEQQISTQPNPAHSSRLYRSSQQPPIFSNNYIYKLPNKLPSDPYQYMNYQQKPIQQFKSQLKSINKITQIQKNLQEANISAQLTIKYLQNLYYFKKQNNEMLYSFNRPNKQCKFAKENKKKCGCYIEYLLQKQVFIDDFKIQKVTMDISSTSSIKNTLEATTKVQIPANLLAKLKSELHYNFDETKKVTKQFKQDLFKVTLGYIAIRKQIFRQIVSDDVQKIYAEIQSSTPQIIQKLSKNLLQHYGEFFPVKCNVGVYYLQYEQKIQSTDVNNSNMKGGVQTNFAQFRLDSKKTINNEKKYNLISKIIAQEPKIIERSKYKIAIQYTSQQIKQLIDQSTLISTLNKNYYFICAEYKDSVRQILHINQKKDFEFFSIVLHEVAKNIEDYKNWVKLKYKFAFSIAQTNAHQNFNFQDDLLKQTLDQWNQYDDIRTMKARLKIYTLVAQQVIDYYKLQKNYSLLELEKNIIKPYSANKEYTKAIYEKQQNQNDKQYGSKIYKIIEQMNIFQEQYFITNDYLNQQDKKKIYEDGKKKNYTYQLILLMKKFMKDIATNNKKLKFFDEFPLSKKIEQLNKLYNQWNTKHMDISKKYSLILKKQQSRLIQQNQKLKSSNSPLHQIKIQTELNEKKLQQINQQIKNIDNSTKHGRVNYQITTYNKKRVKLLEQITNIMSNKQQIQVRGNQIYGWLEYMGSLLQRPQYIQQIQQIQIKIDQLYEDFLYYQKLQLQYQNQIKTKQDQLEYIDKVQKSIQTNPNELQKQIKQQMSPYYKYLQYIDLMNQFKVFKRQTKNQSIKENIIEKLQLQYKKNYQQLKITIKLEDITLFQQRKIKYIQNKFKSQDQNSKQISISNKRLSVNTQKIYQAGHQNNQKNQNKQNIFTLLIFHYKLLKYLQYLLQRIQLKSTIIQATNYSKHHINNNRLHSIRFKNLRPYTSKEGIKYLKGIISTKNRQLYCKLKFTNQLGFYPRKDKRIEIQFQQIQVNVKDNQPYSFLVYKQHNIFSPSEVCIQQENQKNTVFYLVQSDEHSN